jgi:hypothetical protein
MAVNPGKFNIGIHRYPQELGSDKSAKNYHYIVFNICEQVKSSYKSTNLAPNNGQTSYADNAAKLVSLGGSFQDVLEPNWTGTKAALATVSNALGISAAGSLLNTVVPKTIENVGSSILTSLDNTVKQAGNLNFVRTVRRTTETIALYMPDTLNFIQSQGYQDLSLGNNPITALLTGGKAVADTISQFSGAYDSKAFADQLAKNINPYFVNAVGNAFGDVSRAIVAAGQGFVANPMIEVLYSSPNLRDFRYDFVFYPRTQKEAFAVQEIINLFAFHQAPEILPGSSGYFLVPPSEFDIEFHYNGKENVNIPKVSTCVLTGMDVDYAPNGWASYEVGNGETSSMGGTGMPVGIKMSLSFKETTIVTKASRQFEQFGVKRTNFENGIGAEGNSTGENTLEQENANLAASNKLYAGDAFIESVKSAIGK